MKPQIFAFPRPLLSGRIVSRYKRFLADIILDSGEKVTAHVANSGSMKTCWQPDSRVILSDFSGNAGRKLKYSLQAVEMPDGWVGVNTANPNTAIKNAIEAGLIEKLRGYDFLLPEVKISQQSRIDIMLWPKQQEETAASFNVSQRTPCKITKKGKSKSSAPAICFIEIKNVTLLESGTIASFPDAKTTRGQKHLQELIELKRRGFRAMILFFVGRNSSESMTVARHIDPEYDRLLRLAVNDNGVEALAIKALVEPTGLFLASEIPLCL